jgi:hypothetical protein
MDSKEKLTLDDFQVESFTTSEEASLKGGGTTWLCISAGISIIVGYTHDLYHKYSGSTHTSAPNKLYTPAPDLKFRPTASPTLLIK